MTGTDLVIALSRTQRTVKLIGLGGNVTAVLTPTEAIARVNNCNEFVGSGTKRRVRAIRRVDVVSKRKSDPIWQRCWRTSEAAILPPSAEWLAGIYGR